MTRVPSIVFFFLAWPLFGLGIVIAEGGEPRALVLLIPAGSFLIIAALRIWLDPDDLVNRAIDAGIRDRTEGRTFWRRHAFYSNVGYGKGPRITTGAALFIMGLVGWIYGVLGPLGVIHS